MDSRLEANRNKNIPNMLIKKENTDLRGQPRLDAYANDRE
jgi:hypothetical protein